MKKLLVLGRTNNSINFRIVETAKKMGIYTYVVTFDPSHCKEKDYADEYWEQDLFDKDLLIQNCKERKIDGIYGGGDVLGSLALELCKELGLPYYCDADTWKYARDKAAFKQKCREYGVPTAKQYYVSDKPTDEEIEKIEFPVVVKPIDCSGNNGFGICHNAQEFKENYKKALSYSKSKNVIIEKFLQGLEYGAFYAIANGEIRLLNFWSMLSQPGTPHNCYEQNVSVTDKLNFYLENVNKNAIELLKGIGCRDGVAWFEFMADTDGKLYALEMGQRLSGEMMYIPLADVTGFNAIEHMVHYAVYGHNETDSLPESQKEYWKNGGNGYILWTAKDDTIAKIVGEEEIEKHKGLKLNSWLKIGDKIAAHHYGSIVSITYNDIDDLCKKIKFINETYHMYNEKGEDLLIYYDKYDFLRELENKKD